MNAADWKSLGFERWDMGGNCTAYGLKLDDGWYILASAAFDAAIPEDDADEVRLHLFDEEADEALVSEAVMAEDAPQRPDIMSALYDAAYDRLRFAVEAQIGKWRAMLAERKGGYKIAGPRDEVARCSCGRVWTRAEARGRLKPTMLVLPPSGDEPTAQAYLDCRCRSTLGIWAVHVDRSRNDVGGFALLAAVRS